MTEEVKRSGSRARKIGKWSAVFSVLVIVVAGLWYLLAPPYHQFTIVNGSGKEIVMISVQVDDLLIPYNKNVVLRPHTDKVKSIYSTDFLFFKKWFRKARVAVVIRFQDETQSRIFVTEVDTGWNYECRFVIWIDTDRVRGSECTRPEIYDFR